MRILFLVLFILSCGGKGSKGDGVSHIYLCNHSVDPVCGSDNITYQNECFAKKNNVREIKKGICETSKDNPGPCVCANDFNPVCGTNNVTYQNECVAKCDNQSVKNRGSCLVNECTPSHSTVCAGGKNFDNDCLAKSAGHLEFTVGECPGPTSTCQSELSPVCGKNGITYNDSCQAPEDAKPYTIGECKNICTCTQEFNPVCGSDGSTYGNSCLATCAGTAFTPGECKGSEDPDDENEKPACDCEGILNPVCGGDQNTYVNACEAKCEGVEFEPGECKELEEENICSKYKIKIKTGFFCGHRNSGYKIFLKVCDHELSKIKIVSNSYCRLFRCGLGDKNKVCGSDGRTYDNRCKARLAGVHLFKKGECKDIKPICWCKNINNPVCADGVNYKNKCLAIISGKKVIKDGKCR